MDSEGKGMRRERKGKGNRMVRSGGNRVAVNYTTSVTRLEVVVSFAGGWESIGEDNKLKRPLNPHSRRYAAISMNN